MKRLLISFAFILITVAFGFYVYNTKPSVTDYGTTTMMYDEAAERWMMVGACGDIKAAESILFSPDTLDVLIPQEITYIKLKNKKQYDYCLGNYENKEMLAQKTHIKDNKAIFWMLVILSSVFFVFMVFPRDEED